MIAVAAVFEEKATKFGELLGMRFRGPGKAEAAISDSDMLF